MAGLMGEYRHSLDDKGRLTLPARFREPLGPVFIATKGFDNCVFLYASAEWAAIEAGMRDLQGSQKDTRAFLRLFFAGASECRPDGQGRVLLTPVLREYAGLIREAVVVGVSSRVEVWEPGAWDAYVREQQAAYAANAERIEALRL